MTTLELPASFWQIPYDGARVPGAEPTPLAAGANCQLFAYQVLAHFGRKLPDLRSSELWEDETWSERVAEPQPLDLVLYGPNTEPYGAHVGVVWNADAVLHLCAEVGRPAIWTASDFAARDRYRHVIGYKRVREA